MECANGWNAKDLGAKISWDANLQGKPLVQGNNEKGLICRGFLSIEERISRGGSGRMPNFHFSRYRKGSSFDTPTSK